VTVKGVKIHRKYKNENLIYDACLLRTERMNFGPTIGKVPLASPYDNIHDEECLALGWGRTEEGHQSAVPLSVPMSVTAADRQKANCVKRRPYPQFCASSLVSNGGVCNGDSGGPYICKKGGKDVLFGLTSYGLAVGQEKCGRNNLVSAFTDVRRAPIRRWIRKTKVLPTIKRRHKWGPWSSWEACSHGCRLLTKRTRRCINETEVVKCRGNSEETVPCSKFCDQKRPTQRSSTINHCNPSHRLWRDSTGNTCADYRRKWWCKSDGKPYIGWKASWGKFTDFATEGFSALNCPQCGCK